MRSARAADIGRFRRILLMLADAGPRAVFTNAHWPLGTLEFGVHRSTEIRVKTGVPSVILVEPGDVGVPVDGIAVVRAARGSGYETRRVFSVRQCIQGLHQRTRV